MDTSKTFHNAQYRLAQHYLDKLKRAENASRHGRENHAHWLNLVRQDWEQIKQWQAWSLGWQDTDHKRAQLCTAFSLISPNILRVQLTPLEQLAWAQQALEAAQSLADSSAEHLLLYQVAFISLTIEALDQGEDYAQQLMVRAQAAEDILGLGRAWYILGTASFTRGGYDWAEACYTKSIQQFEDCAAIEEIPIVWRGLGRIAQFRGNFQQAQTYHKQYLHASAATGNEQGMLDAHVSLSGVYLSLHDYPAAEHHAQQALALAQPFGKSRFLPPALFSLAHAQKWLGKTESACLHYAEGIAVARAISSAPSSIANGLYGLGQARYLQKDYSAALACLAEALDIARAAQLGFRICQIAHDMVFVHVALQQLDAARIRLRETLDSAQQLGTAQFMTKALAAAISLWQHSGQPEQAAVWAGLLSNSIQILHPSLFNPDIYHQLEHELGTDVYRAALEYGKALTLESVMSEILTLLSAQSTDSSF